MWLENLTRKGLVNFSSKQKFIVTNCQYEVITGSYSYGVSTDTSDTDMVGFCIPPKDFIFPHLAGHIFGFGEQPNRFDQWVQHHIEDKEVKRQYDITIYNIVKFFQLCAGCNPNMVDCLFVPLRCITHSTSIGNLVRDNRKLFLSKKAYHTFKGYAFSQMHKMDTKNPEGKRKETVEKYGYDVKFGYHVLRLLDECEQILTEGDLNLERNREQLKAVRRGDIPLEDIKKIFSEKELQMEKIYHESTAVPHRPDMEAIKELLINCLETHYGSLENAITIPSREEHILRDLSNILDKYSNGKIN